MRYLFGLVVLCFAFALQSVPLASSSATGRVKRDDFLRCKVASGFLCRWTCRTFGHSDGECTDDHECRCSGQDLEKYVCGGDVGNRTADALCAGWCQYKGKQTGDCNVSLGECECSESGLETDNLKCISDTVCSVYCQLKEKKATGRCEGINGWDCVCLDNEVKNDVSETTM